MSNEWQRLSPLAIIYFAARGFMQLLNTYAVVVAGIIAFSQLGLGVGEVVIYILVAVAILVLGSTLYFLNFEYIQEPTRFLIREGVFAKKRTELPFGRIQNVTVKEPFYYRPFNVVVLSMDSAGSSGREVALAALSRENAEAIQRSVQQFNKSNESNESDDGGRDIDQIEAAATGSESTLILTRSNFDILLHGLAHNRAWFILAVIAPLLSQVEQPLVRLFESAGLDFETMVEHTSALVLGGLALLAFAGLAFVLSLFSVAGAILALYDLKLFYGEGTYQRTSGLLTRYETQVRKSRVQTLRYQQNWLDCIANRLNMVLEPFSVAMANENQNMMQKILLPSLTHKQFCALSRHIYPDFEFDQVAMTSVSRLYFVRSLLLMVVPATLLTAGLAAEVDLWRWIGPLLMGLILSGAMYLRWRRLGVGAHKGYLVVRSGLIGREYFCFAKYKTQQVKFKQSLFLKRRGLATLEIVLASRTLQVPLIDEHLARKIAEECLRASALSERSWM